jgi:Nucleotidyl transferase AbiEii toxin, Type IV TA system
VPVEPFKARVAQLALAAAAAEGFALAGGNALAAHGILSRPTQDVDLFSPQPGGTGRVLDSVVAALIADGFEVKVVRGSAEPGADFAQLHVSCGGETTQLGLGRDWRAHDAVTLDIGPVLHLDDAVGAKVTALLGRGLARDYIDVGAALTRYPRQRLLEMAFQRDPGLRVLDVALAAQRLDHLPDEQFGRYDLNAEQIDELRRRFADWPRDSGADQLAQRAHDLTHQA